MAHLDNSNFRFFDMSDIGHLMTLLDTSNNLTGTSTHFWMLVFSLTQDRLKLLLILSTMGHLVQVIIEYMHTSIHIDTDNYKIKSCPMSTFMKVLVLDSSGPLGTLDTRVMCLGNTGSGMNTFSVNVPFMKSLGRPILPNLASFSFSDQRLHVTSRASCT